MGALEFLVDLATILIVVVPVSLWMRWQVNRMITDQRDEREKARLAIMSLIDQVDDLTRKQEDLTRTVDHLHERSQSSSDYSNIVPSGLREAQDMIDNLSDRLSKLTDISFRELTRLGERVSDLSRSDNHDWPTAGNDGPAKD
ncbi:MAG: hypothetical protein ACLQUY_19675 [Ktedonobacterales bacterium]